MPLLGAISLYIVISVSIHRRTPHAADYPPHAADGGSGGYEVHSMRDIRYFIITIHDAQ